VDESKRELIEYENLKSERSNPSLPHFSRYFDEDQAVAGSPRGRDEESDYVPLYWHYEQND